MSSRFVRGALCVAAGLFAALCVFSTACVEENGAGFYDGRFTGEWAGVVSDDEGICHIFRAQIRHRQPRDSRSPGCEIVMAITTADTAYSVVSECQESRVHGSYFYLRALGGAWTLYLHPGGSVVGDRHHPRQLTMVRLPSKQQGPREDPEMIPW